MYVRVCVSARVYVNVRRGSESVSNSVLSAGRTLNTSRDVAFLECILENPRQRLALAYFYVPSCRLQVCSARHDYMELCARVDWSGSSDTFIFK